MNKLIPFRHLAMAFFSCLLAASCSDMTDDATTLPEGKYPMTFTAQVDGLTVSRATTDNSWAGNEEIAIQIGNGEVKKYTAASDGNLTVASGGTPFYWQNTNNITVNAWYPYSEAKPVDGALKVKADQNAEGNYQASDYLEVTGATVTFQNPTLAFKHRTAKVVVTLEAGEGVTDLTDAAVTFVNQTGVDGNGAEITPKTETSNGNAATYTALVIPQQMQNKKFIKVTIGVDGAARDYYYTPAGSTEANLEAGKQYTYTITVKKTGLQVESVTASWDDSSITPGTPTEATFQVHLPGSHGQTLTVNGATQVASSDVYTINENKNAFSISYTITDANKAKGFFIAKGIGNGKRSISDNTCTFTYSNIRSDIWLSYTLYAEVGYYYYNDGTCSSTYSSGSSPACIGIVFKTGAGEGDNVSNYGSNKLADNMIHGYVIALQDANSGNALAWSTERVITGVSTSTFYFYGYSNTQVIKNKGNSTIYPAVYSCANYSVSTPASSSGWYMPSYAQIATFKGARDAGLINFSAASGSDLQTSKDYWTSTEYNAGSVWHYRAPTQYEGFYNNNDKTQVSRYVRAILTF